MTASATGFVFTWNNYKDEDVERLKGLKSEDIKYLIFGKEVSKTGTPHLQGYVDLPKKVRFTACKKVLDPVRGTGSPIHVEIANARDRQSQIDYCSKGLQDHDEWIAQGVNGPNYGRDKDVVELNYDAKRGGGRPAKTADVWDDIGKMIKEGARMMDILDKYPKEACMSRTNIVALINDVELAKKTARVRERVSKLTPRRWQARLISELAMDPDERSVIWYVDREGGAGKSTCIALIQNAFPDQVCALENAPSKDIGEAYKGQRIVLFDLSRSNEGHINYGAMESLKNRNSFKQKWNSGSFDHEIPHLVVFSNNNPDESKMSADRWDIRELEGYSKYAPKARRPRRRITEDSDDDELIDATTGMSLGKAKDATSPTGPAAPPGLPTPAAPAAAALAPPAYGASNDLTNDIPAGGNTSRSSYCISDELAPPARKEGRWLTDNVYDSDGEYMDLLMSI